jgi:hypothetical protein
MPVTVREMPQEEKTSFLDIAKPDGSRFPGEPRRI